MRRTVVSVGRKPARATRAGCWGLTACAIALLSWSTSAPSRGADAPVLVVIGASSRIQNISLPELRQAFLGLWTEVDGVRLVALNQPVGSVERIKFDRVVMGLQPEAVGTFWIDRRIRDQSPPPRTLPSVALSLKVAASLPGAITYLSVGPLSAKVKALRVDGKGHSARDYPLR